MKKVSSEWKVPSSRMAKDTFNPIRSTIESMNLRSNPRKREISLAIGDPAVLGSLRPHSSITQAAIYAAESGKYNGYGPSVGFEEARQAVAEYVSSPGAEIMADDVVLCSGCSSCLDLAISAMADPGQNILVPRPGFPIYKTLAHGLGIATKEYDLLPDLGWEVDLEHLEAQIDDSTIAIVVNNPSNPCGSVFSESHLRSILEVAAQHCVPIIVDEIYDHFVFPGHAFLPMASLTTTVPVLSCGGLSKRYLVPGWRLGWIAIHDRNGVFVEVRKALHNLSQRVMGANSLVQGALPTILRTTPASFFASSVGVVQRNAEIAYAHLSQIAGLKPFMPAGAMYMMIGIERERHFPSFRSDLEVVEALMKEQSVSCLPGHIFGIDGFVRIVLTVAESDMVEACERLEQFCGEHYK
jgi:tyrosine aminotransferase